MRTLQRYVTSAYLVAFTVTLVVFTFVMSIGVLFKVTDLLARGVSWAPIARMLASGIPSALSFSIPISALMGCLLLFGRLSADGEITAMRANGVSLWRVVAPLLLGAAALAVVCVYVNNELAPAGHYLRRLEASRLGATSPTELLEEGRFIQDFEGLTVYIGQKRGHEVAHVRIYDNRDPRLKREIRANRGVIRRADNGNDLEIELFDVRVDPFSPGRPYPAFCRRWPVTIEDAFKRREYRKKEDDMRFVELVKGACNIAGAFPDLNAADAEKERTILLVELNKRLALSAGCFAFVLLGIPLGIKAHRRESSAGIAMSLGIMFAFYLFIVVAESFAGRPELDPQRIVWLPVVTALGLGAILMNRAC